MNRRSNNKVESLYQTPALNLFQRYRRWERVEYFSIGFSIPIFLLILDKGEWQKLGIPILMSLVGFF